MSGFACSWKMVVRDAFKSHRRRSWSVYNLMVQHCCPYCHYTTAVATSLKVHIRVHTGERPYICDHCGAGFKGDGALNNHLATHLSAMPFPCGICGHGFAQKGNCQRHEARCGRQRVKVKEERVLNFLETTGLEFKREVVVWFDRSQRHHHARVDFAPSFDDRLARMEVGGHQHIDYDQRKGLKRTWRLF